MQQRHLFKVFHTRLLHHNKTECYRHPSGLEQPRALICTSRPEPETKQRGTCPWQHGPREWNRWGTEWPEPRVCCGTESMGKHRQRIQVTATSRVYDKIKTNFHAFTLKLAGSTRSWKAWSSLRFRSPEVRSSILLTASPTPPITVFPCFLTGAEPGLRSFQWEK